MLGKSPGRKLVDAPVVLFLCRKPPPLLVHLLGFSTQSWNIMALEGSWEGQVCSQVTGECSKGADRDIHVN